MDQGTQLPEMAEFIQRRADIWTERCDAFMTTLVQELETAETISQAEAIWTAGLANPLLRFVSRTTIDHHEKLTRSLCAEEQDIQYIAFRCWKQLSFTNASRAKEIIENHLKHYGEIQGVIMDEMIIKCQEYLTEEENPIEEKKKVMNRLLIILEILGEGFSRKEINLYKAWWHEFKRGRGDMEPGHRAGYFLWYDIRIQEKSLIKWVINQLRLEEEFVVPKLFKAVQTELDFTHDDRKQAMRDYLDFAETPEDYVKGWWRLSDYNAVSFSMLIDEIRHSMWDPQTLAKPLFRSAGRSRPKQLRAATEMVRTGELGEFFATLIALGFEFTTDFKEILEERLHSEQEPAECFRALKAIGEFRTLSITAYREWKSLLIQRFGEDVAKTCKIGLQIDQELTKRIHLERREKHEALILMHSIENNDPGWHNRLDSWLHEVRESYRIGFQNVYEHWLQIRKNMLREGPCQKGTIETLFYEPCGNRWRISKLKCTAPYHPKMLFEEVASWLQNDVYDASGWEIYDEEGKVDIDTQREPRDGERYVILSPEVSEELKGSMNARFKKFLQATR
jgi:hypothetical protein